MTALLVEIKWKDDDLFGGTNSPVYFCKTIRLSVCGAKFKGRGPVEIFRLVEWSQETCFSGKAFRQATAAETHGKNDAFPAGWGQRIVLENKRFQGQSTIRAKLLSFYKILQANSTFCPANFYRTFNASTEIITWRSAGQNLAEGLQLRPTTWTIDRKRFAFAVWNSFLAQEICFCCKKQTF